MFGFFCRTREQELEDRIDEARMTINAYKNIKDGWTGKPVKESEKLLREATDKLCDEHIEEQEKIIKDSKQELKNKGVPVND